VCGWWVACCWELQSGKLETRGQGCLPSSVRSERGKFPELLSFSPLAHYVRWDWTKLRQSRLYSLVSSTKVLDSSRGSSFPVSLPLLFPSFPFTVKLCHSLSFSLHCPISLILAPRNSFLFYNNLQCQHVQQRFADSENANSNSNSLAATALPHIGGSTWGAEKKKGTIKLYNDKTTTFLPPFPSPGIYVRTILCVCVGVCSYILLPFLFKGSWWGKFT